MDVRNRVATTVVAAATAAVAAGAITAAVVPLVTRGAGYHGQPLVLGLDQETIKAARTLARLVALGE